MDEQKIIDIITDWLIAARESPKDSDASLRLSAKTAYYEILHHMRGASVEGIRPGKQDLIDILSKVIQKYGNSLTEHMAHPDDYESFAKNFNSADCAKRCADALPPSDDLSEIRGALGLPKATPEPLVGVIWRLQQRIEDLEKPPDFPSCGETLDGYVCDEIKGHKGHHSGIRITDQRISWPNDNVV